MCFLIQKNASGNNELVVRKCSPKVHRKPGKPKFLSHLVSKILLTIVAIMALTTAQAAKKPRTDRQPPTAIITSPTGGSTVKSFVPATVSTSDNVGVTRVDLLVNGVKVASDTSAPYGFDWDSTTIADASVTLKATAYDAAGNYSSSPAVTVNVANTTVSTQPTLSLTSSNAGGDVSVGIYPADTSGLEGGTASFTRTYNLNERVWISAPLLSGNAYFVRWDKDGGDFDTAAATSFLMDASHMLTAIYEPSTCAGVDVYPGIDSIKNAVAAHPAGSTFCIKAGIHRFTSAVYARNYDTFIGEPGAVLNGAKVLSSFIPEGSYWVATGQTQEEPTFPISHCRPDAAGCIYPEKVFLDSQDLWQVTSLAELGPGKFYFDYANDKIYLFDNPSGHTIEATNGTGGLLGYSVEFVTVKNLVFEKFGGGYVTGSSHNALKAANNWLVENNEFRLISYIAVSNFGNGVVRNNYIHHNGQYGVVGAGTFEGNTISYNNTDGFDISNDAGGSKFLNTDGLVLKGNTVANNTGRGLWADYNNINVTYENNIVENNTDIGIFHEVSCAAVIKNNVLRGNNNTNAGGSLWTGAQIFTRSSKEVEIFGNSIVATGLGVHGIGIRGDGVQYSTPICGVVESRDINVHDNVIWLATGNQHGIVGSGTNPSATYNIKFSDNIYYQQDLAAGYFQYDGGTALMTKEQWQAAGQDPTGMFYQY